MRQIDPKEPRLFHGWAPKLMLCAAAVAALGLTNKAAMAAPQNIAVSGCFTRGATLLSNPDAEIPAGVSARGTTVLRIDLSPLGHIEGLAVAQSAGDPQLDFEAMRVARASSYAPASRNCTAVRDRVLYEVIFND